MLNCFRYPYGEHRARLWHALNSDGAAKQVGDPLGEGEAQAIALGGVGGVSLVELVEDMA